MKKINRQDATLVEFGAHIPPAVTVKLGEEVLVETNDNMFNLVTDDNGPDLVNPPLGASQYARVNPLAGPIYVEGVEAGDTLVVEILDIEPRDWGWTGTGPGFNMYEGQKGWEELHGSWSTIIKHERGPSGRFSDGEAVMTLDRESRWPIEAFIGTLVVAPERGVENSLVSQGAWGGNIDVRDVKAGNKIHLNATHDGGLVFLGDVHASQGDSELSGMADETAADVRLRFEVIKKSQQPGVCRIETPTSLIQCTSMRMTGGAERTIENAYRGLIDWLVEDHGMSKKEAFLHMTANSQVRAHIYQAVAGFLVVGVEFPKANL